jgi:type I restriction enzyme S subunit
MSRWKECKLGEIATIVDCEHKTAPTVDSSEFVSVRTANISNGRIDFKNSNRVSEGTYEIWTKRMKPKEGDIILAREAPVGEVGWVPAGKKVCLGQRTVLIRVNESTVSPRYLLYYLVSDDVKYDLISRSTGSVVEHLNVKDIKDFDLKIHASLEEQQSIASILSTLDDKIDLLHRQNATLEAMAETLFRQWFVEEAKEEWEEYQISDIADHIKINVKASANPTTLYYHYSLPAFDEGQVPSKEFGSTILSNKFEVLPRTVLVSKLNPRFPRIWPIGDYLADNSICSTEFQVIRPKQPDMHTFLIFLLKSDSAKEELIMAASGTSGSHQRVRPEDILNIRFAVPSIERAIEYSRCIEPMVKKMMANRTQVQTLSSIRDTLLPKLMSGRIGLDMVKKQNT